MTANQFKKEMANLDRRYGNTEAIKHVDDFRIIGRSSDRIEQRKIVKIPALCLLKQMSKTKLDFLNSMEIIHSQKVVKISLQK